MNLTVSSNDESKKLPGSNNSPGTLLFVVPAMEETVPYKWYL